MMTNGSFRVNLSVRKMSLELFIQVFAKRRITMVVAMATADDMGTMLPVREFGGLLVGGVGVGQFVLGGCRSRDDGV